MDIIRNRRLRCSFGAGEAPSGGDRDKMGMDRRRIGFCVEGSSLAEGAAFCSLLALRARRSLPAFCKGRGRGARGAGSGARGAGRGVRGAGRGELLTPKRHARTRDRSRIDPVTETSISVPVPRVRKGQKVPTLLSSPHSSPSPRSPPRHVSATIYGALARLCFVQMCQSWLPGSMGAGQKCGDICEGLP